MNTMRLFMIVTAISALGVATESGQRLLKRTTDFARSLVTHVELSGIRDAIVTDYAVHGQEPDTYDFSEYVRSVLDSRSATRDVSLDLWGQPYEIDDLGEGEYLVYSVGPNGYPDGACREVVDMDPYLSWEDDAYSEDDLASLDVGDLPIPEDDDICVRLRLDMTGDSLFH